MSTIVFLFLLIWLNKLRWIEQTVAAAMVSLGVYCGLSALDKTRGKVPEIEEPGVASAD
ncbi:MAG TPA: hypothetical protein GX507_07335 [Clostridia bacterium]|nr:hypothetical protein [Clostridia bacterium]